MNKTLALAVEESQRGATYTKQYHAPTKLQTTGMPKLAGVAALKDKQCILPNYTTTNG